MFQHCIHLLIDGANEAYMGELFKKGLLPNIARYVVEPGAKDTAITCFPSTTGPAFTPIMTGNFPGSCNIPGVRWFDRTIKTHKLFSRKRFRDYFNWGIYSFDSDLSKQVKTIYEYIPDAASILGFVNRGTQLKNKMGFFEVPYLFYRAVRKHDVTYLEKRSFALFKKCLRRKPRYLFYYFPIVDLLSHHYGMDSAQVYETYLRIDQDIGKIVAELKNSGMDENTLLVITSDHGHENIHSHFDMDQFVSEQFGRALFVPGPYRTWKKARAINLTSGNSMSHIYIREDHHWSGFHDFYQLKQSGFVENLLSITDIEFVMGRYEDHSIGVMSKRGEAQIRETGPQVLSYKISHGDPFGFEAMPETMSWDECFTRSVHTDYPDAIVQCMQLFRSERTGDLVCAASSGRDLRAAHKERPEHRSSHGSLHRAHMVTPLYTNHPIPKGPHRSADIFASTLKALDISPTHTLDGKSFL